MENLKQIGGTRCISSTLLFLETFWRTAMPKYFFRWFSEAGNIESALLVMRQAPVRTIDGFMSLGSQHGCLWVTCFEFEVIATVHAGEHCIDSVRSCKSTSSPNAGLKLANDMLPHSKICRFPTLLSETNQQCSTSQGYIKGVVFIYTM